MSLVLLSSPWAAQDDTLQKETYIHNHKNIKHKKMQKIKPNPKLDHKAKELFKKVREKTNTQQRKYTF